VPVLVQEGRVHRYEGWTARQVAQSVRAFVRIGARGVVLCNAAGSLRPDWAAGTAMGITDQINLQGDSPLTLSEGGWGNPFEPALGAVLEDASRALGLRFERGVYAGLLGPSYETPAEVRLLQALGADAVGMSTVAESQAALAEGARVAGLSWITNPAAGLARGAMAHEDVVHAGRAGSAALAALLEAAAQALSQAL
jgi:purine-nucleoside phosphorylase